MNRNLPNTDLRDQGANLDVLLSSFFKAELPRVFPGAPLALSERPMPVERTPAFIESSRRSPVAGSRMSLAVSVAMLLGGCWLLTGNSGDAPVAKRLGVGPGKGEATTQHVRDVGKQPKDAPVIKPMP